MLGVLHNTGKMRLEEGRGKVIRPEDFSGAENPSVEKTCPLKLLTFYQKNVPSLSIDCFDFIDLLHL